MVWLPFAVLLFSSSAPLPLVVIDPGHGGEKDGAVGACGVKEKDVALAISLRLRDLLRASGKVEVLLTREEDRDVDLEERTKLANTAGAVLFISVHANASLDPRHHGVESYFLSRKVADKKIIAMAKRENEGRMPEAPKSDDALAHILGDLRADAAHIESQRLSKRLQRGMNKSLNARGRGLMQAPFIVLVGAEMAAALVEVGFMSNPGECKKLITKTYQTRIARTLGASILTHLEREGPLAMK